MQVLTRFERLVERMRFEDPEFDGPNLGLGVEGIRDTFAPCELYQIGKAAGDCWTDGHYLCEECSHLDVTSDYYRHQFEGVSTGRYRDVDAPSNRGHRLLGRMG